MFHDHFSESGVLSPEVFFPPPDRVPNLRRISLHGVCFIEGLLFMKHLRGITDLHFGPSVTPQELEVLLASGADLQRLSLTGSLLKETRHDVFPFLTPQVNLSNLKYLKLRNTNSNTAYSVLRLLRCPSSCRLDIDVDSSGLEYDVPPSFENTLPTASPFFETLRSAQQLQLHFFAGPPLVLSVSSYDNAEDQACGRFHVGLTFQVHAQPAASLQVKDMDRLRLGFTQLTSLSLAFHGAPELFDTDAGTWFSLLSPLVVLRSLDIHIQGSRWNHTPLASLLHRVYPARGAEYPIGTNIVVPRLQQLTVSAETPDFLSALSLLLQVRSAAYAPRLRQLHVNYTDYPDERTEANLTELASVVDTLRVNGTT
jgi:hypothetical protein